MQNNQATAQEIVEAFNTWKYKREQPYNLDSITEYIQGAIDMDKPIKFLMYWGKGDREEIGEPEKKAFDFLDDFFSEIKKLYSPGVQLVLLCTDTHAKLNGYDDQGITSYFNSIKDFADKKGYKAQLLSDFVSFDEKNLSKHIEELEIAANFLELLVEASGKHYKVSNDYEYAAKLYYLQNQLEKKALDENFPDSIFLTFNGSDFNPLFPEKLPIFYMYSLEKGTSVKPWFI